MPPRLRIPQDAGIASANSTVLDWLVCPSCAVCKSLQGPARRFSTRSHLVDRSRTQVTRQERQWLSSSCTSLSRRTRTPLDNVKRTYATSLASSTAVNPPTNVPSSYQDLHSALHKLGEEASGHVDQSRLQLALRGLESVRPTTRIGLLGVGKNGVNAAKRLARVLLADALGQQETWESKLASEDTDGKALLLRYGAEDDILPTNPLLVTVNVPSRVLQRNNLEILITPLNVGSSSIPDGVSTLLETLLVPTLQTPVASSGRAGFVRYPVHKTLIVGEGIEGCIAMGRLSHLLGDALQGPISDAENVVVNTKNTMKASSSEVTNDHERIRELIRPVVDLPRGDRVRQSSGSVDTREASAGLALFRQDVKNGPLFSEMWQASGVTDLMSWMSSGSFGEDNTAASEKPIRDVSALIDTILETTKASTDLAETTASEFRSTQTISDEKRAQLQSSITIWAQYAHTDLQHSLTRAFDSRSWRRTSWVRLLWRIDDVGVAAEDVLRSYWLLEAETALAFLAGKVEEAGFFRSNGAAAAIAYNPESAFTAPSNLINSDAQDLESRGTREGSNKLAEIEDRLEMEGSKKLFSTTVRHPTSPELLRSDNMLNRVKENGGIDVLHARPWPLAIEFTRQKLLHTLVPALQSRAQALLLQSFTTIGATSALGTWFYFAINGVGIYEAGAVAALGLVWTLRRLQKKWEHERRVFEGDVKESARVVLSEVEGIMRSVVRENERPTLRSADVDGWLRARGALEWCQTELDKLR